MEIEQLLEQYFEGLTSAAEEVVLRRYFTSDDVSENLMMYKPLFMHFDSQIKKTKAEQPKQHKSIILWICGAAACAALLVGSFLFSARQRQCPGKGDYVLIDGRCYTDAATIRKAIQKTLLEVSESDELVSSDKPANVIDILENQLKEFDFLLEQ